MAKPIEPTPVIRGVDAKRIREDMRREETRPDPDRVAYLRHCKEVYRNAQPRAKGHNK